MMNLIHSTLHDHDSESLNHSNLDTLKKSPPSTTVHNRYRSLDTRSDALSDVSRSCYRSVTEIMLCRFRWVCRNLSRSRRSEFRTLHLRPGVELMLRVGKKNELMEDDNAYIGTCPQAVPEVRYSGRHADTVMMAVTGMALSTTQAEPMNQNHNNRETPPLPAYHDT
ncbi:hypothetical protein EX30DRAFT_352597 [Ascodesmis nigricans]|uniref:Uncharacterized protein n=1 Tax=Ascodesmis nigricans TaxID=341454 RepID=A0A4S2MI97_9PEZI|nr:hypothetical protein EX30DRAFT_352597 [Ascodesmis nigricans]